MSYPTYQTITSLPPIATSTTRAAIDAAPTTRANVKAVMLQLTSAATTRHFIGDGTVVAAGSAGVIAELTPGSMLTLPVGSTNGLFVVTFTGGAASTLFVAVAS